MYRDMDHVCRRAEQQEREGAREMRRLAEARAVAGPEHVEGTDGSEILVADGGEDVTEDGEDLEPLDVGDYVVPDGRDATTVVMCCSDRTAGEYFVERIDETVAEYNECDPDERVYEVVFANRTDKDLADCKRYPYPRSALTLEERLHGRGDENGGDE
ncbi:hypothetical protein EA472_22480 [Natrarchaeobius oligotrophus]|uniref:Uncharacterized protein n=2 Tax=Natrarchaeobius TaxID=2501796 RepID=A0A3N6MI50_NATCH|nr:hypothetical protein EA472_22480 [Natrarchaeobius chitinivorans]